MTSGTAAFSVEDLREAIAFARAFYEGDGDGAALLFEASENPVRLMCVMADLVGDFVHGLAESVGAEEDEVWRSLVDFAEEPVLEFTRRRNR